MNILSQLSIIAACLLMLFIAWEDFREFRIQNKHVLTLIGFYLIYASSRQFNDIGYDLIAGFILFGLGIGFWLLKLMGAGDAKLYFPVGLFVGFKLLSVYAIFLVIFSVLMLLVLKVPIPLPFRHKYFSLKFDELRKGKQVPYAIPITFSAIAVLLPRIV